MARKTANGGRSQGDRRGIEAGDTLLMELPVAAVWPEGKVTVTIAGARFTFGEDHPGIRDVLKAPKEKAERGQKRLGGSAYAQALDDGRGWSRK